MKIIELQDRINAALAQLDGRKYEAARHASTEYHRMKAQAIGEALDGVDGAEFLGIGVYNIDADIDGSGGLRVAGEHVAKIRIDVKRNDGYERFHGPGTIKTIRVEFRDDLLDKTLEETRVQLLKEEKERRLAYLKGERERLAREIDETASKIAEIEAVEIEEAGA